MELFRIAFKNLLRKPAQTFLTIFGVTIGMFSVLLISAIGDIGGDKIRTELSGLGFDCLRISSTEEELGMLDSTALELVSSAEQVEAAVPVLSKMGRAYMRGFGGDALICGVDENAVDVVSIDLLYGEFLQSGDIYSAERVCVVDSKLAESFYSRSNVVGKQISLKVEGYEESFRIVGVIDAESNALRNIADSYVPCFVYIPYTAYQELRGSAEIDQIFIKVAQGEDAQQAGTAVTVLLDENAGYKNLFRYDDLAQQKEALNSIFHTVTTLLSAIGGISLLVSGLGIMTIMMVSVRERMREIGIKKAIGAPKGMILMEFLLEALMITLIGSVFAIALTQAVILCGRAWIDGIAWLRWDQIRGVLLFSVAIGVIFGVYPAKLAASLRPVEALRQE